MFTFAPPVKVARKQRTTIVKADSSSASLRSVSSANSVSLFNPRDVVSAFVGKHHSYVICRVPNRSGVFVAHAWQLQPDTPHLHCHFELPDNLLDEELFFGEGARGRSVLALSTGGSIVSITLSPTSRADVTVIDCGIEIAKASAVDGTIWIATKAGGLCAGLLVEPGQVPEFESADVSSPCQSETKETPKKSGWLGGWFGGRQSADTTEPTAARTLTVLQVFPSLNSPDCAVIETNDSLLVARISGSAAPSFNASWFWKKHSASCRVRDAVLSEDAVWILSAEVEDDGNTDPETLLDVSICTLASPNHNAGSKRIALPDGPMSRAQASDADVLQLIPFRTPAQECAVVSSFSTCIVALSTDIRSPTEKEMLHEHADSCLCAALDRSCLEGAVFVFSSRKSPQIVPSRYQESVSPRTTSVVNSVSKASLDLRGVEDLLNAPDQLGRDGTWLSASEDICNETHANPHNWAKGDIDADDLNLLSYVRQSLENRVQKHNDVLTALQHRPGAWGELQPETRALLISRQEQLLALSSIREFQNNDEWNDVMLIEAREKFFRETIRMLGTKIRDSQGDERPSTNIDKMSSTEICFNFIHHCVPMLEALNEQLRHVAESFCSIEELVASGLVAAQAWLAVVDSIEQYRGGLEEARKAATETAQRPYLWTLTGGQQGFEQLLMTQCMMVSDVLKQAVLAMASQNAHLPSKVSQETETHCMMLGDSLGALLRATFQLNSRGAKIGNDALRRTLLCEPFAARPVGYPHGPPLAVPCPSSLAEDLLSLAETLALEFGIVEVLWDFAGATCVLELLEPEQQLSDHTHLYDRLRQYCAEVPGMYEYAIRALLAWHREQELSELPNLVPVVRDGHPQRTLDDLLLREAPHAHWLVLQRDGTVSTNGVIAEGQRCTGPPLAETANDHRIACLGLAKLSMIAGGRQLGEQRKIQNEAEVAQAQRRFFPDAASALARDDLVQALIKLGHDASAEDPTQQQALIASSKLAEGIPESNKRDAAFAQLLQVCASIDGSLFDEIRADDSMSEAYRTRKITQSVTGNCVAASLPLRRWALHDANRVAGLTGDAFAAVLKSWANSSFAP